MESNLKMTNMNKFQGMAAFNWCYDSINQAISDGIIRNIIDRIAEQGYSGITFANFVHVDASGKFIDLSKDKIDRMWVFVDYARSKNLLVDTKIHWTNSENSNWNQYNTPATFDIHNFLLTQAQPYLIDFAKRAQQHGVSKIYLGSENDNFVTADYRADWAGIISSLRSIYSGKLTWDANYFGTKDQPLNNVAIWDFLDSIALSFYPKLSAKPTYDVEKIVALFNYRTIDDVSGGSQPVWGPVPSVVDEIKALSQKYGLPIELGEVNYQPVTDNLLGYVGESNLVNVPKDYRAQDAAYQALAKLIAGPWKGVVTAGNFFSYDAWPYMFSNSVPEPFGLWKDYSLHGTPAEVTLSKLIRAESGNTTAKPIFAGTISADIMNGTSKDELFFGFENNDTIAAGGGIDTIVYHGIQTNFTITKTTDGYLVKDNHGDAGVDLVQNSEYLAFDDVRLAIDPIGPPVNLELIGTFEKNKLVGGLVDDRLMGLDGNDTLTGLLGNDTLDGGAGSDLLAGGGGDDVYYVDSLGDKIMELGRQGTDTVVTLLSSYSIATNVENLIFSSTYESRGIGNTLANSLTGGTSNDSLDGRLGSDTLTGGAGADRFVLSTKPGATNIDTITDFVSGVDMIQLSKSIFSKLQAGMLAEGNFIGGDGNSKALDSNDYLIFNGDQLLYDADGSGNGGAVVVAKVVGAVSAVDILVV